MSDFQKARALFAEAHSLSPDERSILLDARCGNNESLRNEIESLLFHHDTPPPALAENALGLDVRELAEEFASTEQTPIPECIGDFRIIRQIAVGGMGSVYEAEQHNPRRRVALKVIRVGIASRSTLRRFEFESQLLARLRHPNIAQIYRAGTDQVNGATVPYFAMEFIPDAKQLTTYAKDNHLGTRDKLELFIQVCEAIHYGHQKGIIHRDIKPGNLLVDSSGRLKVIDFGVARSTDSDMAVTTIQTDIGQLIGTIQYMSPEQCKADPNDIDIRSDVYTLGVVLFELLTYQMPYKVSRSAIHEATRIIREDLPTNPSSFDRTLRGDIETIVLKAMEKECERRYESASAFAQDIRRYLKNEPISARPATASYQLRQFVRRNRGLSIGCCTGLFALIVGTGVATWQAVAASQSRQAAALEAKKVATINKFIVEEMLLSTTPERSLGRKITVEDVLKSTTDKLDTLRDEPELEAFMRHTVGTAYQHLGLYDQAAVHLRRALELREDLFGREHVATVETIMELCSTLKRLGDLEATEPLQFEAYEINKKLFGEEHSDTLDALNNIGSLRSRQHRFQEAVKIHRKLLDIRIKKNGNTKASTYESMHNLAFALGKLDELDEAEQLLQKAIEGKRRLEGETHPSTLYSESNLATLLRKTGRLSESEAMFRLVLAKHIKVFGPDHIKVTSPLIGLCKTLILIDRPDALKDAVNHLDVANKILSLTRHNDHWSVGRVEALRGICLIKQGDTKHGTALLLEACGKLERGLGVQHSITQEFIRKLVTLSDEAVETNEAHIQKVEKWRSKLAVHETSINNPN